MPSGSWSTSTTPGASAGPLFVTVTEYVSGALTAAGFGFAITRTEMSDGLTSTGVVTVVEPVLTLTSAESETVAVFVYMPLASGVTVIVDRRRRLADGDGAEVDRDDTVGDRVRALARADDDLAEARVDVGREGVGDDDRGGVGDRRAGQGRVA